MCWHTHILRNVTHFNNLSIYAVSDSEMKDNVAYFTIGGVQALRNEDAVMQAWMQENSTAATARTRNV